MRVANLATPSAPEFLLPSSAFYHRPIYCLPTMKSPTLLLSLLLTLTAFATEPTTTTAKPTPTPNVSVVAQAKAALQNGDLAAAETLLVPLTIAEKPDAAACHQLALVRQRQRRAADAVTLLERATALDAAQPEYFSALGAALSERMRDVTFMQQAMLAGKMKKAFAKSVELDAQHIPGLIGLARFYANAPEIAGGSLEKAQEFATRVQKLHPFLGALELGTVAERAEDFAAALAHFDAASALQPKSAGAHAAAGRMLAHLGRKAEARTRLQHALELDPQRDSTRQALAALTP